VEAQRAFQEAARLDPTCAMCFWGLAHTAGSNYNSPTDATRETAAWQAVQQARAAAGRATERERALIEALARRHSPDPRAERAPLDRAYADAMREVMRRFPDDLEAATLFADAMMNLRPWDLWQIDGTPQPGTEELVQALERVLARNPDHPGATHLYIHAVEASPNPGRAEAAADRLRTLMPGAGHMVHMPAHTYWRIGRYADAYTVNVQAVEVDRAAFRRSPPSGIYRMGYYPHNIDFVWHLAGIEGRAAETLRAARELAAAVPVEALAEMSDMESAHAAPLFALARFGRWPELLAEPAPPASRPYVRGIWHYGRGLALAATGQRAEAERELAALRALADGVPPARTVAGFFKTAEMLRFAADVLAGEVAARAGQTDEAVRHLTGAVRQQDTHWFIEPPPWYYPVRHSLGAALLAGGRAPEAEGVYREDLRRNPENGWALFGLAQALRAQGQAAADAEKARGLAEAEIRKAQGLAEAESKKAQGLAEALAMEQKAAAWEKYGQAALLQILAPILPEIARAVSEPLSKVDRITLVNTGGNGDVGVSRVTGELVKVMAQMPPVVESLTGLRVGDLLGRLGPAAPPPASPSDPPAPGQAS
jgi:tetratricopeptide (TPR) repeat protein